ncbi:spermatid-specific linker histone H1-like protein [Sciurus carolinensis]|nr:spermatid-specific linker histone H1-like protein [Sciurus carolinensis]
MQKDTSLQSPSIPSASNATMGGGRQASASGVPNKSENGHGPSPKAHRKPSMSKVIMRAMADKGTRNRVSLAALKKAVTSNGYNMTHNIWRFKRVLKKLVDNGMLQQVTGRGTSGSFRLGKKQASKLKAKRRQQRRRSSQRRSGQRRSGQHRSLLGSKQGHKRLFKGVRRVAKCRRH